MRADGRRKAALEQIQHNIDSHGHHIYVVSGTPDPRFAYTIGLSRSLGFELILAGSIVYMLSDVTAIINHLASRLTRESVNGIVSIEIPCFGAFSLRNVHLSWVKTLMLGALDFYQAEEIPALQVMPDQQHWTVDIPNMSEPWSPVAAPAWQWLKEPWTLPIPKNSMALTNLAALSGERVTEAARWQEDYWELFAGAGPDVAEADKRVVPVGLLLTVDTSLGPVINLSVGKALWRDALLDWQPWGSSEA